MDRVRDRGTITVPPVPITPRVLLCGPLLLRLLEDLACADRNDRVAVAEAVGKVSVLVRDVLVRDGIQ
jgi:hypothetical protein